MWRNVVKVSERVMWRRLIVEDFLLSRHVDKYTLKELLRRKVFVVDACGGGLLWSYVDMVIVKE